MAVVARGLQVGYGEAPVCAPVDLDAGAGEVLAVVGPNGSGKSTVLRTLLGRLAPLGGTVEVLGRPVDERERAFRARVAGVGDDDAYFPGLSVREHLVLLARGHGVNAAGEVVDATIELLGLQGRQDASPTELSSGQRRRLLLATAFVRPRDVLVLDEPEQRLDPGTRRMVADLLAAEAGRGVAVVVATHDPELAERSGARGLVVGDDACTPVAREDLPRVLADVR
ncbi:ABC transporter ATP-binding protein [Cellulosimicrobium marinum]|uniref:ABC transporter ATP-binding protein n=1 Tax=Cellulosimicrobium marinum TaxID=1638992 RepID=UPI001E5B1FEC|nr:ABC transporter ATP-binding protein [Cellulosimicrobium marinum]MCB7137713.1 ABC transporter ATP-binding protein [Cellulosimicrobium marinum]